MLSISSSWWVDAALMHAFSKCVSRTGKLQYLVLRQIDVLQSWAGPQEVVSDGTNVLTQ